MPLPVLSMLAKGASGGAAPSSLLTGLVAYWKLDEASTGARVDSGPNGLTLTDNGASPAAAGQIGNAANLNGSTQFLSRAHNALLSPADTSFAFGFWFNQTSTTGVQALVGKGGSGVQTQDYLVYVNSAIAHFHTYNGDSSALLGDASVAVPTGWNFLSAWQDVTGNSLNIQINNGTPVTVSRTGAAVGSTGVFSLGMGFASSYFLNGKIDEVGFWSRVLTAGERTWLWNSGAGRTHPF